MAFIEELIEKVKATPRRIVFAEAAEPRILAAAVEIKKRAFAVPVLAGDRQQIEASAHLQNLDIKGIEIVSLGQTTASSLLVESFCEQNPSASEKMALRQVKKPLIGAGCMVRSGLADAMVAGVIHPSARVIMAASMTVGLQPGIQTPSSYFIMLLPPGQNSGGEKQLLFADCAVTIDPSAEQLADIAQSTAHSARALLPVAPRVALLSFSTSGSAQHPLVDKVKNAMQIIGQRGVDFEYEGEMQVDAALSPVVAHTKMQSPGTVAGRANVLIFPGLESGNIAYKLVQYLAGAQALGPILQGFSKPVCDLSRGASVDDIIGVSAIAAAQVRDQ